MTHTHTSTPASRFLGAALALVLACLLASPVRADMDLGGTKQALAALGQFQRNVQGMRAVVNTQLGPYPISTQCTWCSEKAWYGFGFCTTHTTQTQSWTIDFNWTRTRLSSVLRDAEGHAATFAGSFSPTQAWLTGLPAFSKGFASTADLVLAVQAEIRAGNGPTEAQRQRVTGALGTLVSELKASSQKLSTGTSALTAFLQRQSAFRDAIKNAIGGADQSARQALASYENETKTWRCQDGLAARFNQMKSEFSVSTQRISQAFEALDASSRAAEKALATMVGTLVSSQSDYQAILDQVVAAQKDQLGSFLERLHLSSAKNQWQQLADYASQNL